MGLDAVELVLKVEEVFPIRISDAEAERIRTVGELIAYIQARLQDRPLTPCLTGSAFYRFRRELLRIVPVPRAQVHPDQKLEKLVPARGSRRVWRQLRLAGLDLPPLQVSPVVKWTSIGLVAALTAMLAWWLRSPAALALAAPLGLATWLMTRPLAVHPAPFEDVRGLVLQLAAVNKVVGENGSYSQNEIAQTIRLLVAEQFQVAVSLVRDGARFNEDLGAG